jgi:hypothetical protein
MDRGFLFFLVSLTPWVFITCTKTTQFAQHHPEAGISDIQPMQGGMAAKTLTQIPIVSTCESGLIVEFSKDDNDIVVNGSGAIDSPLLRLEGQQSKLPNYKTNNLTIEFGAHSAYKAMFVSYLNANLGLTKGENAFEDKLQKNVAFCITAAQQITTNKLGKSTEVLAKSENVQILSRN